MSDGWYHYVIKGDTPEEFEKKLEKWLDEFLMHEGREVSGTRRQTDTETSCIVKRRESC